MVETPRACPAIGSAEDRAGAVAISHASKLRPEKVEDGLPGHRHIFLPSATIIGARIQRARALIARAKSRYPRRLPWSTDTGPGSTSICILLGVGHVTLRKPATAKERLVASLRGAAAPAAVTAVEVAVAGAALNAAVPAAAAAAPVAGGFASAGAAASG